jgi:hypothetical protein
MRAMHNSFSVVFKGMDTNKDVETEVRAWIVKIRPLTDAARMLSGRVIVESIERTGAQRNSGVRYGASVEIATLDEDVVAGPDHADNAAHEDVYVAVRNAFRLVRRELAASIERRSLSGAAEATGDVAITLVDARPDGEIT